MASVERKRNRIGRREVLTLGAGAAAGAGVATAAAVTARADADATAPSAGAQDPRATTYRDTDHIRRYYERARY